MTAEERDAWSSATVFASSRGRGDARRTLRTRPFDAMPTPRTTRMPGMRAASMDGTRPASTSPRWRRSAQAEGTSFRHSTPSTAPRRNPHVRGQALTKSTRETRMSRFIGRCGVDAKSRKSISLLDDTRRLQNRGVIPSRSPAVSVVMPCLNEAETVAACVTEALAALRAAGLDGEVIVADNGSSDASRELAAAAGARVVEVEERGYGAALLGGIAAARGRAIVMGDADLSYDFGDVPAFVRALEGGADLVMGSRLRGRIEKGAMPPLHRWVGNPVLSGLGRLFFPVRVSDFHCGIRGFTREAVDRMALVTTGMEFASEMVVKAALLGLVVDEIPVTLRKDGRSRRPHLRTWRDGWRHLRFLLLYSPRWLFLLPGLALVAAGTALGAWLLPGPRRALGATLDVHTMLGAAAMVLVGAQAIAFAVFAKVFAVTAGLLPRDT